MSAHLQFGPEWMRKGRGKTSTSMGAGSAGDAVVPSQDTVTPLAPSNMAGSKPTGMTSRRNPSLGNLSASAASSGPTSLSPSAPTPSAGAFSFAAAAQAGSTRDSNQPGVSSASSSSVPHSSEGESARYSKRLLSLYSSERGGKGAAPGQDSSSSGTVQGSKSTAIGSAVSSSTDRDSRRSAGINVDGSTLARPHTPPSGEARGLNARTAASLHEKAAPAHRPGLFQRGSNGSSNFVTSAALSPTTMFQSRDRDRHGTGIQGGVLSGVAAPLSARRRKESESGLGIDSLRSPRTPMDVEHQWDQRRTNDAFTSARNRSNRTTAPHDLNSVDGHGAAGVGVATAAAPSVTSNGEVIETWSRLGGRRERAPGEGPIGPPSDHSGGFARFAGHERRRERLVSMPAPKQSSEAAERKNRDRDEGHSSSDVDLSKHATYVLDSLQLDDDEEDYHRPDEQVALQQQQHNLPSWTPEMQDWLYRDPSGQVQGPFKANLMQDWYAANYFDSELLVRRAEDDTFQTLGEMLQIIGNTVSPFLIPPTAYARPTYNNKMDVAQEQPASHAEPLQQQQINNSNPLGWPGNLDILNHYGNGSGHSSPFATPQGHFAELDNGTRLRQKTQQEQYNEMMRQRELAEQRAMYEQRAAQMAAIAMAQSQGRDPASLGLWGGGGEWNQMLNQSQPSFDRGEEEMRYHQQQQQQQQQQYYEQMQRGQPVWESQSHAQGYPQGQTEPVEERSDVAEHVVNHEENGQEQSQPQQASTPPQEQQADVAVEAEVQPELQTEAAGAEDVVQEEVIAAEEEQSPEQAWPQSPTAVEFASEPLMSEEQWSKEESPSRGKKSRRDRAKQKTDEEVKQDRAASSRNVPAIDSGSIKTMTEEQFRRNQAGSRDINSSVQTPLSSWLPDTPAGVAATKSAPWASNAQDNSGLSLREIQEAEARQADARKAARPRLQLNTPSSSDSGGLPTTLSWGLASSHSNSNGREAASTPAAAAAPAWNARQAPKKTLMEIQEEERKRAQKIKDAQATQSEGKSKAYADSASKMQSSTINGAASSWSVVGASGKPSMPTSVLTRPSKVASPISQRTASSTNLSATATSPAWNSNTSNGPSSKTTARKGAVDGASTPSPDFIRHCKEQLKGLNVKVDDFIEMLLSFPLDPSPEVVEIIAESVYASSSTLDGRRFAADFVAKRKLDANQGKPSSGAMKGSAISSGLSNGPPSTSTPRSLSDVLKTTPSSNDGFGGFKVVKAKGAKKRI